MMKNTLGVGDSRISKAQNEPMPTHFGTLSIKKPFKFQYLFITITWKKNFNRKLFFICKP